METGMILYPILCQVALTLIILVILAKRRLTAAYTGKTDLKYFQVFSGETGEPHNVVVAQRSFMNQFEMPVVFYALALSAAVFGKVTEYMLWAAWAYAGLRVIHAIIHISVNHVMWRFRVFMLSNIALMAMLILFVV